jgi:hypothetical protein
MLQRLLVSCDTHLVHVRQNKPGFYTQLLPWTFEYPP